MKKAEMFPIESKQAPGYVWKWRCVNSKVDSNEAFTLYYDCLMDAQRKGYEVELTRARGVTAPGGVQHGMR